VDDAIIAVEMMVRKMEEGYDKVRAATFAYEITAMPMLTGTLITAAGFLPIGIAKSVTGEYTFAIFAVTVIALVLSWVVSVYFRAVPGHAAAQGRRTWPPRGRALNSGGKRTTNRTRPFDSRSTAGFRRAVNWCVQHRWITIGATLLTFALGIVGMGKVQQQFFPDSSRPEILVDMWFPEGTSFAANEALAKRVEQRLMAEPGVQRQHLGGLGRAALLSAAGPGVSADQRVAVHRAAQGPEGARGLRVKLPPAGQEFPEVRGRVKLLPNGPPVPYPVQFRVVGPDPRTARARRRGQGRDAPEPQHARRQRQLERVGQGAAPGGGPGQGARAGCDQPVHRPGLRTMLSGTTWASSARATS
jgi:multidrug efflux pump